MSRYRNNMSWSSIGLVFCLAISLFLWVSIDTAQEIKQEYTLPIYISKEATISGYSSYTIECELTNLTNRDVKVDLLEIAVRGRDGDTYYHADQRLLKENFVVPANSSYKIEFNDIVYVQMGETTAKGELTDANVSECILNGESVELKEKDGEYFVTQGGNSTGYIAGIVIGCLGLLGAISIIIYKIVDKYSYQYDKHAQQTSKNNFLSPQNEITEPLDSPDGHCNKETKNEQINYTELIVDYFINEQGLEANVEIAPNGDKIITINYCINYLWTLCIKVDETKQMIKLYTPFCNADSLKDNDIYSQLNKWNKEFFFVKFFVKNTSIGTFVIAEQDILLTGKEFITDFVSAIADDFVSTIDEHFGKISQKAKTTDRGKH